MKKLSDMLLQGVPVDTIYICLLDGDVYRASYCSNSLASLSFEISAESPEAASLREREDYLIVSEFRNSPIFLSLWESERRLLSSLSVECIAAMKEGSEVIGLVLLCGRKGRKAFTAEEISFIQTITAVASMAVKNAAMYEKMYREARIDSLTGAFNYRAFVEREQEMFTACGRDGLSLIFVDVDDFKLYNQLYGVAAGDEALRNVFQEISQSAGEGGSVYRSSGKVFAVLLPYADTERAKRVAEEIMRRVRLINHAGSRRHMKMLSASIGICSAPLAASSAAELLDNADMAAIMRSRPARIRL